MRKILFFIVCIVCTTSLMGQTPSGADREFRAGNYTEAQKTYKVLLKSYPSNQLYLYRYARCAQELGDDLTAVKYFEKSGNRYKLKHYYAGQSYLRLWRVEEALNEFNTYLDKQPDDNLEHTRELIEQAEKLQRYMRRVEQMQVIDSVKVPLTDMLKVVELSAEAGSLSLDTNHSLIYTNQRKDRKIWAANDESRRIIVSNHRLLDTWSPCDTFPETINFAQDQCSPYMLTDGLTIYFAAKYDNGLGGLDIYMSRYNTLTESFTTPENLGMPYNSPANEYMMVIDETRRVGYLATDRFAEPGHVHVYSFAIPEQKQYWRNIDQEMLISYAQLKQFDRFTEKIEQVEPVDTPTDEIEDFSFIINDSIVYQSLSDFAQTSSKEKYQEYTRLEQQLQADEQQLELLRKQYTLAENEQRKQLAPSILQLENSLTLLAKRSQLLLQEIRQIEMSAQ